MLGLAGSVASRQAAAARASTRWLRSEEPAGCQWTVLHAPLGDPRSRVYSVSEARAGHTGEYFTQPVP